MARSRNVEQPADPTDPGPGTVAVVAAERLEAWVAEVLRRSGVQDAHARTTATVLVAADLQGIDSHGVARLPAYLHRLRTGATATAGEPRVERAGPATALVDGGNLTGPAVADFATREAIARAEQFGVGIVAVRESNHFGIAGYYARRAAERGLVGFACTNAGPRVAPTGSDRPFLGTNPFALAVPTTSPPLLVVDMATSAVATGKLELATRAGRSIPEGWGVDRTGAATTDPDSLRDGGWLLPLGSFPELSSHKGFGLGLVVEVLAGLLGGGPYAYGVQNLMLTEGDRPARVGHCVAAVDPGCFGDPAAFVASVSALVEDLHRLPPTDPASPVVAPGEPEWFIEQRRRRDGVPLVATVLADLEQVAEELSVGLGAVRTGSADV